MVGGISRSIRWIAPAAGACALYGLLALNLPEVAPTAADPALAGPEASAVAGPEVIPAGADAHDDACHEHEEAAPGHVCGLDAKAMFSRFQDAIGERRGAVHRVVEGDRAPVVAGQVTIGYEAGIGSDDALAALARRHGLEVRRAVPGLNQALLARVATDEAQAAPLDAVVAALAREPGVRWAEPNYVVQVARTPNDPFLPLTGNRGGGLEQAWDLSTGDPNVLVALLDTGVDPTHPDLTNRLVAGFDVVNQTAVMSDDNGHGTAMAGIIAAEGDNALGVVGVAFDCRLVPVKVADALGQASVADVAAGIDYALGRQVRVINLSMGASVPSQALRDAVDRALAAGVVVVAAAGNDPVNHDMFPASYPGVLSTTAVGEAGIGYDAVVAAGVDLGAPGEKVVTTLPGSVYGFVSGTSAAAAYASGAAALVAARSPGLTGAQIANVLRAAQHPVKALEGLEHVYRFGRLDPHLALLRSDPGYPDLAVTAVRSYPTKPIPGQPATLVVEVSNQGNVGLAGVGVSMDLLVAGQGIRYEVGERTIDLQPGERRELRFDYTAPVTGRYHALGAVSAAANETERGDNQQTLDLDVGAGAEPDLRIVALNVSDPTVAAGALTATVTVENRGTAPATNVSLQGAIGAAAAGAPAPTPFAAAVVPLLAVGERVDVPLTYTFPLLAPAGIQRLSVDVTPLPGELAQVDNHCAFDLILGSSSELRGLYQQSNDVDVIHDAPWRVDPSRPYVPVQVFVASKGGQTNTTRTRIERTTITVRDTPTGPETPLYTDTRGAAPSLAPNGLVIADEMGVTRASGLDLFGDLELTENGRHEVLRIPRDAVGAPAGLGASVVKYLDVKAEWKHERLLFYVFTTTRSASHRSVLKVHFPASALPEVPGDNHYHDVHHHTIAEWYFGSPLDIFAPRKAYGGPLQMVFESAYAMGFTPGPTAQDAFERIITTDHNCFNNTTIPNPDSPNHRPPFGPQSPTAQPGLSQMEAFRTIFGRAAGEEIAFRQDVPIPKVGIPFLNNVLNALPGIPIGAHMLLMGADHVEGPWHGGGWLRGPGNPNISVDLGDLLRDAAKNRQGQQGASFAYAAHPFSGQGWRDTNLDEAFGLDPAQRTLNAVHDQTKEFVLKGVEFFNGRGTRSLPSSAIDFNDLNPWANASFAQGSTSWDSKLWSDVTTWHEMIAKNLEYSFVSDPEVRLVRKVYQAGGSDAHGDFNFNVARAATPLNVQSTYNVGDEAWYGVRTYCLGDGKPGATSEERWLQAYADGNTVITDGPLVTLNLDADGRFDSGDLSWHDAGSRFEDEDGRIGGGGAFDGGYTALVERGADAPVFGYRYESSDEWGPIAALHLYKTEAGAPNPTRPRGSGNKAYGQVVAVNHLALGGAGVDLEQPLDAGKEGPVTKPTAFAAGAYTGGDPDVMDLGPDAYRAYTNPVYAVPFDADVTVGQIDSATATIPAGALEVRFTFDISMDPGAYAVEVKGLDANGDSTDKTTPALATLVPQSGSGWSDRPGIRSSVFTLTNQAPIPVSGAEYPRAGEVTFVVYWRDPPRDHAGNALNSVATTFTAGYVFNANSTASASTAGAGGGGGGGGGGCALAAASPAGGLSGFGGLALLGLLLALTLTTREVARRTA